MTSRKALMQWYLDREGKVAYSHQEQERLGPESFDSSSALFSALIAGQFLPEGTALESVEFLYRLNGVMMQEISRMDIQEGDLFIRGFGLNGNLKANAYCGVVLSQRQLITCSEKTQGIGRLSAIWIVPTTVRWYRLMEPSVGKWRPKQLYNPAGVCASSLNFDFLEDNCL